MDIKVLEAFIEVADSLSFTDTAAKLYLSPSALSRQISELEKELDAKLFERDRRSVSLTTKGTVFLAGAKNTVTEYHHALELLEREKRPSKMSLKIGFFGSPFYTEIPPLIRKFREACPDARIKLLCEPGKYLVDHLVNDDYDLVFGTDWLPGLNLLPDLNHQVLCEDHFAVVLPCDHPLSSRGSIRISELRDEQFIAMENDPIHERAIRTMCESNGFHPIISRYARDVVEVMIYVESGCGISIQNTEGIAAYSEHVAVIPIEEYPEQCGRKLILWKKTNHNPAIEAFLNGLTHPSET